MAIIGVVAALTIPTVVRNYQKMQLKTALKKQWSVFNQVMNKVAFDMGGAQNVGCFYGRNGIGNQHKCATFYDNLSSDIKVAKKCNSKAFENGCQPQYKRYVGTDSCEGFKESSFKTNKTYILQDGSIVIFYSMWDALFLIDVNGKKAPNMPGYDIFMFKIVYDGKKLFLDDNLAANCFATDDNGLRYFQYIDKW